LGESRASLAELHVLELFHGPTLAFKDIALQFLGELFDHVLARRGSRLNILAATSGDTGSAAIASVKGKANVNIAVMFPQGRVSQLQELQMTTVADANVHCLALQGNFDDCQSLMKDAFSDLRFKSEHQLGAVNSVNWARVLAQVVYYAYASLRLYGDSQGEGVNFSVPTGNFGNIFAGYLARRMGFPIRRLLLATNENDILATFFTRGCYSRGTLQHTLSPSMDIQVASNFERFLYYGLNEDTTAVVEFMRNFKDTGSCSVPLQALAEVPISAQAIDTETALAAIKSVFDKKGYVLDPHTAVGVAAAQKLSMPGPTLCLATAHPAKFPESVARALGSDCATHPALEALRELPTRCVELPATAEAVRGYIEDHLV
jgi:threonine synthase